MNVNDCSVSHTSMLDDVVEGSVGYSRLVRDLVDRATSDGSGKVSGGGRRHCVGRRGRRRIERLFRVSRTFYSHIRFADKSATTTLKVRFDDVDLSEGVDSTKSLSQRDCDAIQSNASRESSAPPDVPRFIP